MSAVVKPEPNDSSGRAGPRDRAGTAAILGRLGAAGGSCDLTGLDNYYVASQINLCVGAAIQGAQASVQNQITAAWGKLWATVTAQMAGNIAAGAAVDVVVVGFLEALGAEELAWDVNDFLIAAANTVAIPVGETLASTGLVAAGAVGSGAAAAGWIGAVIGLIIAAVEILVQVFKSYVVQPTYTPAPVDAGAYIAQALPAMQDFLLSKKTLAGLTPMYVAKSVTWGYPQVRGVFLANPTWLWANQALTGMCQPPVPAFADHDAVQVTFTQLPGAYEATAKAQFVEAAMHIAAAPSQLPFFFGVIPGASGFAANGYGPDVFPDPDPFHYNPAWLEPTIDWMPASYSAAGRPNFSTGEGATGGAGAVSPYVWPWNGSPTFPGGTVDSQGCGGNLLADNATWAGQQAYYYAACPNLVTNDNTVDGAGNVTGQTHPGRGVYTIQGMFPGLNADLALILYAANYPSYQKLHAQALNWVQSQPVRPDASALGPGSTWNFTPDDARALVASWGSGAGAVPVLAPPGSAAAPRTTGGSPLALRLLVGGAGLAAIATGAYALSRGVPVVSAARTLAADARKPFARAGRALSRVGGRRRRR